MEKKAFIYSITILSKAYDDFNLDNESKIVWFELLKDMDGKMFLKNVKDYTKKYRYPPTISDLRCDYDDSLTPEEAWELAREYTYNRHIPKDADPTVRRALQYVGLMNVYMCDTVKLHFIEKDFIRAYKSFQYSAKRDELMLGSGKNIEGLPERKEFKELNNSLEKKYSIEKVDTKKKLEEYKKKNKIE